ncbi:MAG: hypothetical protein K0U66_02645 [Gammaproteobacteria bacterium]|nr:hypothetical protein [Gammaproteobacteria bacterium]
MNRLTLVLFAALIATTNITAADVCAEISGCQFEQDNPYHGTSARLFLRQDGTFIYYRKGGESTMKYRPGIYHKDAGTWFCKDNVVTLEIGGKNHTAFVKTLGDLGKYVLIDDYPRRDPSATAIVFPRRGHSPYKESDFANKPEDYWDHWEQFSDHYVVVNDERDKKNACK